MLIQKRFEEYEIYHLTLILVVGLHLLLFSIFGNIYKTHKNKIDKNIKITYILPKIIKTNQSKQVKIQEKTNYNLPEELKNNPVKAEDNKSRIIKKVNPVEQKITVKKITTPAVKPKSKPKKKYNPISSILTKFHGKKKTNISNKINDINIDFNDNIELTKNETPQKNENFIKSEKLLAYGDENIIRKKNSDNTKQGNDSADKQSIEENKIKNEQRDNEMIFFNDTVKKYYPDKPIIVKQVKENSPARSSGISSPPQLLNSPPVPAPVWFEKKGVITGILFLGTINNSGYIKDLEVKQSSGYYKLDIFAKNFIIKNWQWEPDKGASEIQIKLETKFIR